jgi:hypothetical protein
MWFVHAQKMHQLRTNQLVVWFVHVCGIIDPLVIHPSPHLKTLARPSSPLVLRARECTPTFYPFVVFTFGLIVESIKGFGSVSKDIFNY